MRTLTSTLSATQKRSSRAPVIKCTVEDRPVEVPRFAWANLYTGSEEDNYNAAVVAYDGSIVRARSTSAGKLYIQRVTDPTNGSQWSNWTELVSSGVYAAQTALAADDGSSLIRLFYVTDSGRIVRSRESTDNGASWGAAETVVELGAGYVCRSLGADGRNGDAHLVYSVDPSGTDPDDYLAVIEKVGGSWQSPVNDSATTAKLNGIAVAQDGAGKLRVFFCDGAAASDERSMGVVAIDISANPDSFGTAEYLIQSGAGSNYDYQHPWLVASATAVPRHFFLWVEKYSGSPASTSHFICCTPSFTWLTEAWPLQIVSDYGFALLRDGSYWYLIGVSRAYRSPVYSGAASERVEVSGDVVAFEAEEPGLMRPSRLTLWLENSDSRYANAGASGTYQAIKEGSQVVLRQGYHTPVGEETVYQVPWWVDRVSYEDDPRRGEGHLVLECLDAWGYLDRFRVPRQVSFTNRTLGYILQRVWWRVSGKVLGSESGGLGLVVPEFALMPGESYGDATRRLCQAAGVALIFRTAANSATGGGWDSVEPVLVVVGTGTSAYSYGPTAHPVLRARYTVGGQAITLVECYGESVFDFWYDWTLLVATQKTVVHKFTDRQVDTSSEAASRVLYERRWVQMRAVGGWLEIYVNVGQELGDVIDITDARANLSAAARRVVGIHTYYDTRRKERYVQRLMLAGV